MVKSKILVLGGPYDMNSPLRGQGGIARTINNIVTSHLFVKEFNFDYFDDSNPNFKVSKYFVVLLDKITRLIKLLLTNKYDSALVFCNSINLAFLEKFLIILIIKMRSIKIFVRYGYFGPIFNLFFSMQDGIIVQEKTGKSFYGKFKVDKISSNANFLKDDYLSYNKKETKTSQKLKVILVAGKDYIRKGFHHSIDAVKLVSQSSDFEFKVISSNKHTIKEIRKMNLFSKIKSLPHLDYNELKNLLSVSDILILPSSNEGLPNLILESMANGLVILTTGVGSIADVVIDGENGFIINTINGEEIANLLIMINENRSLLSKIRVNNTSKIKKKYSEKVVIPKLINFLKE